MIWTNPISKPEKAYARQQSPSLPLPYFPLSQEHNLGENCSSIHLADPCLSAKLATGALSLLSCALTPGFPMPEPLKPKPPPGISPLV